MKLQVSISADRSIPASLALCLHKGKMFYLGKLSWKREDINRDITWPPRDAKFHLESWKILHERV